MKTKIGILERLSFPKVSYYLDENHLLPSVDYHSILSTSECPSLPYALLFSQKTILPHSCLILTEVQRRERTRSPNHWYSSVLSPRITFSGILVFLPGGVVPIKIA